MTNLDITSSWYIDPAPAYPDLLAPAVQGQNGGAAVAVIIVTCGAELGVDAIIDIGVAIIVIAE